jgi:hypothetical protein
MVMTSTLDDDERITFVGVLYIKKTLDVSNVNVIELQKKYFK